MLLRTLAAFTLITLSSALAEAALTPAEEKIVAAVDAQFGTFVGDLEKAVRVDSATENFAGVRQVSDLFGAQLSAIGFSTRFAELPASTTRAGHLVAELAGNRGKRLLLIGHLDTVLPGGAFRVEGTKAFGSGTSDLKGGSLALIYALRALHTAGALADSRIIVIMPGDEESTGRPVEVTRRELFDAAKRSDLALGFENAINHTATVARRGSSSWEIEVQGATGHASLIFSSSMGAGSIFEAARILQSFYQELHVFDGLTFNVGMIVGGTEATLNRTGGSATGKTNIIPQNTKIRGELRAVSNEQLQQARAAMTAIVAKNLPRTSATITFGDGKPAMPASPENYALLAQLDQVSRDLGFPAITAYDPRARGAADIAYVSPPLPALDGLGLRGGGEHAPSEWADLATGPEIIKRNALLIYRLTR